MEQKQEIEMNGNNNNKYDVLKSDMSRIKQLCRRYLRLLRRGDFSKRESFFSEINNLLKLNDFNPEKLTKTNEINGSTILYYNTIIAKLEGISTNCKAYNKVLGLQQDTIDGQIIQKQEKLEQIESDLGKNFESVESIHLNKSSIISFVKYRMSNFVKILNRDDKQVTNVSQQKSLEMESPLSKQNDILLAATLTTPVKFLDDNPIQASFNWCKDITTLVNKNLTLIYEDIVKFESRIEEQLRMIFADKLKPLISNNNKILKKLFEIFTGTLLESILVKEYGPYTPSKSRKNSSAIDRSKMPESPKFSQATKSTTKTDMITEEQRLVLMIYQYADTIESFIDTNNQLYNSNIALNTKLVSLGKDLDIVNVNQNRLNDNIKLLENQQKICDDKFSKLVLSDEDLTVIEQLKLLKLYGELIAKIKAKISELQFIRSSIVALQHIFMVERTSLLFNAPATRIISNNSMSINPEIQELNKYLSTFERQIIAYLYNIYNASNQNPSSQHHDNPARIIMDKLLCNLESSNLTGVATTSNTNFSEEIVCNFIKFYTNGKDEVMALDIMNLNIADQNSAKNIIEAIKSILIKRNSLDPKCQYYIIPIRVISHNQQNEKNMVCMGLIFIENNLSRSPKSDLLPSVRLYDPSNKLNEIFKTYEQEISKIFTYMKIDLPERYAPAALRTNYFIVEIVRCLIENKPLNANNILPTEDIGIEYIKNEAIMKSLNTRLFESKQPTSAISYTHT